MGAESAVGVGGSDEGMFVYLEADFGGNVFEEGLGGWGLSVMVRRGGREESQVILHTQHLGGWRLATRVCEEGKG